MSKILDRQLLVKIEMIHFLEKFVKKAGRLAIELAVSPLMQNSSIVCGQI